MAPTLRRALLVVIGALGLLSILLVPIRKDEYLSPDRDDFLRYDWITTIDSTFEGLFVDWCIFEWTFLAMLAYLVYRFPFGSTTGKQRNALIGIGVMGFLIALFPPMLERHAAFLRVGSFDFLLQSHATPINVMVWMIEFTLLVWLAIGATREHKTVHEKESAIRTA
jgi:hypothetical protein